MKTTLGDALPVLQTMRDKMKRDEEFNKAQEQRRKQERAVKPGVIVRGPCTMKEVMER
jgi:hypothetical protein